MNIRSQLMVLEAGFDPLGTVVGAGAFNIIRPTGCQFLAGTNRRRQRVSTSTFAFGGEPTFYPDYEEALRSMWRTVLERLVAEAVALRAHGIVNVTVRHDPVTNGMHSLQMIGTAVRCPSTDIDVAPFVSMLSMEDSLKLLLEGWIPRSIVFGLSAVHVHLIGYYMGNAPLSFSNVEVAPLSSAMQMARRRAEDAARSMLATTPAEGVIGASLEVDRTEQNCSNVPGALVEGRFMATSVVRFRDPTLNVSAMFDLAGGKA